MQLEAGRLAQCHERLIGDSQSLRRTGPIEYQAVWQQHEIDVDQARCAFSHRHGWVESQRRVDAIQRLLD